MRALVCVFLIACGGGDDAAPSPLIQTTLTGQFNNKPWTPAFGFGRVEDGRFGIFVGTVEIACTDDFDGVPRNGTYAAVGVTAPAAVGTFDTAIQIVEVVDNEPTMQIATGDLMITAASETEVSAVLAFDLTISGGRYALNGAVTVQHCP